MSVIIPRNFVLLEELENEEKGKYKGDCSVGLRDREDILMHNWSGLIVTHPDKRYSLVGEKFINLKLYCGEKYPDEPPTVTFDPMPEFNVAYNGESVIDNNGCVKNTLPIIKNWTRENRMINIVQQLKTIIEKGRI